MRRRRKRRLPGNVAGLVVLDSGATTRIARERDVVAREIWRELTERGWRSCVPAVTLAEVVTGRPREDAATNLLLRHVGHVIACDEALGRAAGARRFAIGRRPVVPSSIAAIVAAVAAANQPSIVLTTDPDDLGLLLADEPRAMVVRV